MASVKSHILLACIAAPIGLVQLPAACDTPKEIIETGSFVLGDNDSRNDARQLCFLDAKRKALDKVGGLIESDAEIQKSENAAATVSEQTHQRIKSFAAAVVAVEAISEQFDLQGGRAVMNCSVKISIDIDDIRTRMQALMGDRMASQKIDAQQRQIAELESKIQDISARLKESSVSSAAPLRKERNVTIDGLDQADNARIMAVQAIQSATERAMRIEVGMTQSEVLQVAGEPRAKDTNFHWNYGNVWAIFGSGVLVSCLTKGAEYGCQSGLVVKK